MATYGGLREAARRGEGAMRAILRRKGAAGARTALETTQGTARGGAGRVLDCVPFSAWSRKGAMGYCTSAAASSLGAGAGPSASRYGSRATMLLGGAGAVAAAAVAVNSEAQQKETQKQSLLDDKGYPLNPVPTRVEQIKRLRASADSEENVFDVLIIGGGATGTGMAVDAATRGLKTALVEGSDFASGTSSRSTKLAHGGVRYLEKAVKGFDYSQLKLVFEALHERKMLLQNAPHLSRALPIMTPCYSYWEIPYFWAGMKAYDALAGNQSLTWSRYISSYEAKRQFPTLRTKNHLGEVVKGSIVYYDGQFNDARLCVLLACTAAEEGAAVANYTEVTSLVKDPDSGRVIGAKVKDKISGNHFKVMAKQVVNACGPFADGIRKMSDPETKSIVSPSAGVHVTLPDYYSVEGYGMIIPKTNDGRVVFLLPWEGHTIAGTTESVSEITLNPRPSEKDIQFILEAIEDFLSVKVRRSDVSSAWSGIRPLVADPDAKDSASIVREHLITTDKNGLLTICGGKWTTYRKMAEEGVDRAIAEGRLSSDHKVIPCKTNHVKVVGGEGFHPALHTEIAQEYVVSHRPGAIDTRVAKHLTSAYGDRARVVTRIAEDEKLGHRLSRGHPQLEAEVPYTVRYEYCTNIEDFLARRTRLAFCDVRAAEQALPRVVELMAKELNWGWWKRRQAYRKGKAWIATFASGTSD